jgi:hypothetical protein
MVNQTNRRRSVRKPIFNPNAGRHSMYAAKKLGGIASGFAKSRVLAFTSKIPVAKNVLSNSEFRIQEAKRRRKELIARKNVNPRLEKEITDATKKLISFRAKNDQRLSGLIYKIRNGTANQFEKKIFEDIIARTTAEVMEKKGIPLQ